MRKLGAKIGCDPMTVLHHFRSKNDLMREIADRALTSVALPPPSGNWKADLRKIARAYRDLAHPPPAPVSASLPLSCHRADGPRLKRVCLSGRCFAERIVKAGAAGMGLAFYAILFEFAGHRGMMFAMNADRKRIAGARCGSLSATLSLIPAFKALNPDAAFNAAVDAFVAGVAIETGERKHTSGRAAAVALIWRSALRGLIVGIDPHRHFFGRQGLAATQNVGEFSAIMMTGTLRLPLTTSGMIEASMTRKPSTPCTRASLSTTAISSVPIRHVQDG